MTNNHKPGSLPSAEEMVNGVLYSNPKKLGYRIVWPAIDEIGRLMSAAVAQDRLRVARLVLAAAITTIRNMTAPRNAVNAEFLEAAWKFIDALDAMNVEKILGQNNKKEEDTRT